MRKRKRSIKGSIVCLLTEKFKNELGNKIDELSKLLNELDSMFDIVKKQKETINELEGFYEDLESLIGELNAVYDEVDGIPDCRLTLGEVDCARKELLNLKKQVKNESKRIDRKT